MSLSFKTWIDSVPCFSCLVLFQAEENWCCSLCSVVLPPVPPPGWELSDESLELDRHSQACYRLPMLPCQLCCCCRNSQTTGSATSQIPKVRTWTVICVHVGLKVGSLHPAFFCVIRSKMLEYITDRFYMFPQIKTFVCFSCLGYLTCTRY